MRSLLVALILSTLVASCTARGAKITGLGAGGVAVGSVVMYTSNAMGGSGLDELPTTFERSRLAGGMVIGLAGGLTMLLGMGVGIRGWARSDVPQPTPVQPTAGDRFGLAPQAR